MNFINFRQRAMIWLLGGSVQFRHFCQLPNLVLFVRPVLNLVDVSKILTFQKSDNLLRGTGVIPIPLKIAGPDSQTQSTISKYVSN